MKKRSKYRPRPVLLNPVMYVVEGLTPVAKHDSFLMDLKIKNHAAMTELTQGRATRQDIDTLIQAVNMTEALYLMGFGREYKDVVAEGLDALHAVGARGATTNRFILRAPEMAALNLVIELHDAQLDLCVVKDIEKALALVRHVQATGRARPMIKKEPNARP